MAAFTIPIRATLGTLLILALVSACSSDADDGGSAAGPYDAIYDTPPSSAPTRSEVRGTWNFVTTESGVAQEQRLKVADTTLTIANRCSTDVQGPVTVGVAVGITLDEGTMTVNDPGGTDSKSVAAAGGKPAFRCLANLTGPGSLPYSLGNGVLQLGGVKWSKVAD